MLEAIDKYKFGILAAFATYILLFMWFQMDSFETYFEIVPYNQTGRIEPEDEQIELKPENVEVSQSYSDEVLNMVRDMNDTRESSMEEFYQNKSTEQIAADIAALEREMEKEAGGAEQRKKIQSMIDDRKKHQEEMKNKPDTPAPTKGGDTQTKHTTMVAFDVPKRVAFNNDANYVKNPGYTGCHDYKVTVYVDIKVDGSGRVTSATYNSSKSSGATHCEIDKALKYAKLSRFEPKNGAISSGWISYIFMP